MTTIALVDDDQNVLTSVSTALKAEGYSIAAYNDGALALKGFRTAPPDFAIFDMKMPHMDGMETLRQLRAKSNLPVKRLRKKFMASDSKFDLLESLYGVGYRFKEK